MQILDDLLEQIPVLDNLLLSLLSMPLVQLCLLLLLLQSIALIRLRRRFMLQTREVRETRKELGALLMCERGIAERIKNHQNQMQGILSRQEKMEEHGPAQANYKQAIALMKTGISADELAGACDMSRGELELISHLQHLKAVPRKDKAA